jgi:hypothetical protein
VCGFLSGLLTVLEWAVDGASKLRCLMMQRVLVVHACQGAVLRRMISPLLPGGCQLCLKCVTHACELVQSLCRYDWVYCVSIGIPAGVEQGTHLCAGLASVCFDAILNSVVCQLDEL